MTKQRTENNRAWEKERRDRLNRSFNILAKFLPNYDDSGPYSKIEIIQKSILLIKDLQHKLKDELAKNHKDILNTILELEEALKAYIIRNKVLSAVVKKCGETAPPFAEPKICNYIVTCPLEEKDLNELYVKENGRPPKNTKAQKKRQLQTLDDIETVVKNKKKRKLNKNVENLPCNISALDNGTGSDVPKTSTLSNVNRKLIDEPTKCADRNPNAENTTLNEKPLCTTENRESKAGMKQSQTSTHVLATGILLPLANLQSSLNLNSGPIIVVNALAKSSAIMPKPITQKKVPGKVAISPLKSRNVPKKHRIRRTKKEIEKERKNVEPNVPILKPNSTDEAADVIDGKNCDKIQKLTDIAHKANDLLKTQETESNHERVETAEPTLPQQELSNDILASLQITQNDSNNESMSPTAAFLMSFPVVSSAGARIGDDEQETQDAESLHPTHNSDKPASETNILDKISNLLTTKDYEKFVEDAVKNDAANSQNSEESVKDSRNITSHDKTESAMIFDFRLRPIVSSCGEVKPNEQSPALMKTSVTCSSTYLPEIGDLSFSSSTTRKQRKSTSGDNLASVANVAIIQNNLLPTTTLSTTSTVPPDEYIRNQSSIDFITSSSTVLHNLEPSAKMVKLGNNQKNATRVPATLSDEFLNSSVCAYSTNSVTMTNSYSPYKKNSTMIAKQDTKSAAKEDTVHFNSAALVPPFHTVSMDSSLRKTTKLPENQKSRHSFLQPFAITTTDNTKSIASVTHCSENQFNHSFYSYPSTTITYSSTAIPHFSTSSVSSADKIKTCQESVSTTIMPMSIDKTIFTTNHSTSSNATSGFYTSLTNIGTTHSNLPQYPSSIMRPNMYTSALSLSSSSNQKVYDYAPQTPFTFSLTAPSNIKRTTFTSCQQSQNYLTPSHSTSYAQDYNPFAFENISSIPAPMTPYPACREASQFSFSLTSTTNKLTSKNPSQNSFSIDNSFLTDSRTKPIAQIKSDMFSEKKLGYELCAKDIAVYPEHLKSKDSTQKVEKSVTKNHVNWMTSTTDLQKNENPILPPIDYTQPASLQNHYLPQATTHLNIQKNTDIYFAHPIGEENFSWSPNKLIDTPNIHSTTLPNLHGDLALNSITPKPQLSNDDRAKNTKIVLSSQQNVPNPTNSFSVSQLVDHPKSITQSKSYEDSPLQQKGSKSSSNQSRAKHKDSKKMVKQSSSASNFTPNILVDSFAYNEPIKQNNSNNYSAEALISMNPSKKEAKPHSNYANTSEFCNQLDASSYNNIDYVNESNYNCYNNSYFPQITDNDYFCGSYTDQQFHNKPSRSSVPTAKHLTPMGDSSYTSHSSQNNLYAFPHPSGKQPSQYKNSSQLSTTYSQSRSYPNSNKKQFKQDLFPSSYDPNTSTNYFTPSLNINSPMITPLIPAPHNIPSNDDFNYTSHLNYHSGLSKNTTYSTTQQMSENNQGNVMVHGNVGGNAGNLITNFNLSTIFPEINDKTRQQNW